MASNIETLTLSSTSNERISKCVPCFYDEAKNTFIKIQIPDAALSGLTSIHIKKEEDLAEIPDIAGNYWILTNEPVNHCLHAGTKCPKKLPSALSVIYNGVSGTLKTRAKEHLLREDSKGGFGTQSGISLDLMKETPEKKASHAKCMWAKNKKMPKVLIEGSYKKPSTKTEVIDSMNLSVGEKEIARSKDELYFKNGINVKDVKHIPYNWIFVFVPIKVHSIRDYVENEWRNIHGVPVLCSYISGR
jgi:hypothetical protein